MGTPCVEYEVIRRAEGPRMTWEAGILRVSAGSKAPAPHRGGPNDLCDGQVGPGGAEKVRNQTGSRLGSVFKLNNGH